MNLHMRSFFYIHAIFSNAESFPKIVNTVTLVFSNSCADRNSSVRNPLGHLVKLITY